jgi:hypothetical protein
VTSAALRGVSPQLRQTPWPCPLWSRMSSGQAYAPIGTPTAPIGTRVRPRGLLARRARAVNPRAGFRLKESGLCRRRLRAHVSALRGATIAIRSTFAAFAYPVGSGLGPRSTAAEQPLAHARPPGFGGRLAVARSGPGLVRRVVARAPGTLPPVLRSSGRGGS